MLAAALGLSTAIALADAQKDFEMLFGAEAKKVSATRTTVDDGVFAGKLLEGAKALGDATELQVLVCEKAYEFGLRHRGSYAKALAAIELLEKAFPKEPDKRSAWQEKKLRVLDLQYKQSYGSARKAAGEAYLDTLLGAAEAKASGGKLQEALGLYIKAFPIATYVKSPLTKEIIARRRRLRQRIAAIRKREARLKSLTARLAANPKDTRAREELIRLHVVELDKPADAVGLINDDVDEMLRTYVPLAAKQVEDLPEQASLELATWYEQLAAKASAEGKATALRRAVACYRRYLTVHAQRDAAGLKAKVSLARVEKALATLAPDSAPAGRDTGPKELVLHLSFDRNTVAKKNGRRVVKHTGKAPLYGVLYGGSLVPGRLGEAIRLDGIDDYVEIAHSAAINPPSQITVACWARCPENRWNATGCLVNKRGAYMLHPWLDYPKRLSFYVWGGLWRTTVDHRIEVDIRQWHHYAGTYDGSEVRMYVDGALAAKAPASGALATCHHMLWIGKDVYKKGSGPEETRYFAGTVDDVRIYSRALRPAEIQTLAAAKNRR